MDFIITDAMLRDQGYLDSKSEIDIDVGVDNDFQLKVRLSTYDPEIYAAGNYIYCLGTEYGGRLDDPEVSTSDENISFTGDTFRGMLAKRYIEPPDGESHRYISGELNTCIAALIKNQMGAVFTASSRDTGVILENYKFDRYCSLLDGITKMLNSVEYRLNLEAVQAEDTFIVELSAMPITDYSDLIETSQDCDVNFTIKQYTNLYKYMLCLGSGELTERMVLHLHLRDDEKIELVDTFPDGEHVYLYNDSNTESEEELLSAATDKFKDINSTDTQQMTIPDNMEAELGDVIGGRDYITGITIKERITQKIINIQNGAVNISYKIGDGD
jgi:hypothetical protein